MVEAFNVFNHVNILDVNNTFGTGATPLPDLRPADAGRRSAADSAGGSMELLTTLAVVATLSVPARTSANVSLAADGRTVVAVWSAALPQGQTDIYASVSRDSGTTFSEPVRVNSTAGDARVNGEQPPRVVLTPGRGASPRIVVVWTAGSKAGTTLQSARSDDGGKTFGSVSDRARQ